MAESLLSEIVFSLDEDLLEATAAFPSDAGASATAYGRSLAFDWVNLRLRFDTAGNPVIVTGQAALVEDLTKALLTPRFQVPIYGPDYGADFEDVVGDPIGLAEAKVRQVIEETLLVDPRVRAVGFDLIEAQGDGLRVAFHVIDFTGARVRVPAMIVRT